MVMALVTSVSFTQLLKVNNIMLAIENNWSIHPKPLYTKVLNFIHSLPQVLTKEKERKFQ